MPLTKFDSIQATVAQSTVASKQKELGQYFTPSHLANFMASLLSFSPARSYKILDAGAGLGILSSAVALKAIQHGVKDIQIDAYEVDQTVIGQLCQNFEMLKAAAEAQGVVLKYSVINKDFLISEIKDKYDLCALNPPYFKYPLTSPYANSTAHLFKGNPNIYASFIAKAVDLLAVQGELVFLTPRSFASGFFFKSFREFLYKNTTIKHLHVFKKRNSLFKQHNQPDVLQENVIVSLTKGVVISPERIKCSAGDFDTDLEVFTSPYSQVFQGKAPYFMYFPESCEQLSSIDEIEKLPCEFDDTGYFISTGPVVTHRVKHLLHTQHMPETLPLIDAYCIKPMRYSSEDHKLYYKYQTMSDNWLMQNKRYVMLKRVSAKHEAKRITACVYEPSTTDFGMVAIENHVNVIGHRTREIDEHEAIGLAVFLQSELIDRYFRCVSGSTQVNATDIRHLKFPALAELQMLGKNYLLNEK